MKQLFKFTKSILSILLLFLIVCSITTSISAISTQVTIRSKYKNNKEYTIQSSNYLYINELNFFVERDNQIEESSIVIKSVYDKMPNHIHKIFDDWIIIVADEEISNKQSLSNSLGVTYIDKHKIWVQTGFDDRIFAHECGHAIDLYFGDVSNSIEFQKIYDLYHNKYIEYNLTAINDYSVSANDEYFSALFVDYLLHPDYFYDNCSEGYNFFAKLLKDDMSFSFIGDVYYIALRNMKIIKDATPNIFKTSNIKFKTNIAKFSTRQNDYINPDQYQSITSKEKFTAELQMIIDKLLDISSNPYKYESYKSTGYIFEFDRFMSKEEYNQIVWFTQYYFGDENLDLVDFSIENGVTTKVYLKVKAIIEAEKYRAQYDNEVENILRSIKDGSDTEKMIQISKYILDNSSYVLEQKSTYNSFYINQKGDCVMYAMIFKQFANRLGIENDIVRIPDEHHVYNRIRLEDGSYRYYDLTNGIVDSSQFDKTGYQIY